MEREREERERERTWRQERVGEEIKGEWEREWRMLFSF